MGFALLWSMGIAWAGALRAHPWRTRLEMGGLGQVGGSHELPPWSPEPPPAPHLAGTVRVHGDLQHPEAQPDGAHFGGHVDDRGPAAAQPCLLRTFCRLLQQRQEFLTQGHPRSVNTDPFEGFRPALKVLTPWLQTMEEQLENAPRMGQARAIRRSKAWEMLLLQPPCSPSHGPVPTSVAHSTQESISQCRRTPKSPRIPW